MPMFQKKDLVTIAVFTLLTVMAWIAFDVYHAAVSSTTTEVEEQLVAPLEPKLNAKTIERIQKLPPP